MIAHLEVLTPEQCALVRAEVHRLRDHWTGRGGDRPTFFTLGAASYIDASVPEGEGTPYASLAAARNPLLRTRFDWLYALVMYALSRHLRAPVALADGVALPGFHIWEYPEIITTPTASVHFDLQYELLGANLAPGTDVTRPISFTLPVQLPRAGGGLNVWAVAYDRFAAFVQRTRAPVAPADVATLVDPVHCAYTPGVLALHSGHTLHQIAPVAESFPGDERLTLQGHGLLCNGVWRLYW